MRYGCLAFTFPLDVSVFIIRLLFFFQLQQVFRGIVTRKVSLIKYRIELAPGVQLLFIVHIRDIRTYIHVKIVHSRSSSGMSVQCATDTGH